MRNIPGLIIFCAIFLTGCHENKMNNNSGEDDPIGSLEEWLAQPNAERKPLESLSFSKEALSKSQAEKATTLLFQDWQANMIKEYEQQWNNRVLKYEGHSMPFYYHIFGDKPADGRSLFISMHGGGGAPASVNDQQYENQKHLYDQTMKTLGGVYLAPRAPTDTWNLWHQDHIDNLFNIVIQMAVAFEDVNPNKVYLMGYSAGGDGVYQLAPRMADRWAAASMMAGHPNETSPLSLQNLPFAIHVGALDDGYNRNLKALEWKSLLDELESNTPGSYIHQVQLHEGLAHWMELQDAVALPWMKSYLRNPIPESITWKQDDRHHNRFYWIGTPENLIETGGEIQAGYNPQTNEITIDSNYGSEILLYLNDEMLNLDEPVTIKYQDKLIARQTFKRSIINIYKTLAAKGDSELSFPCVVSVIDNQEATE